MKNNEYINKEELQRVKQFAKQMKDVLDNTSQYVKNGQKIDKTSNTKELGEIFNVFTVKREFIFPSNQKLGYHSVAIKPLTINDELMIREEINQLYQQAVNNDVITPEYSYILFNKVLELSLYNKEDKTILNNLSLNDYISFLFFVLLFNTPKKQLLINDTTYKFDELEIVLFETSVSDFIKTQLVDFYGVPDVKVQLLEYPIVSISFPQKDIIFEINLWKFFENHKETIFISSLKLNAPFFTKIKVGNTSLNNEQIEFVIKETEIGKYVYSTLSALSSGTDGQTLFYGVPSIIKIGENELEMEQILSSFFRGIIHS